MGKIGTHMVWKWFKKGFAFAILAFIVSFLIGAVIGGAVSINSVAANPGAAGIVGFAILLALFVVDGWILEIVDKQKQLN